MNKKQIGLSILSLAFSPLVLALDLHAGETIQLYNTTISCLAADDSLPACSVNGESSVCSGTNWVEVRIGTEFYACASAETAVDIVAKLKQTALCK